ncbi:MAG: hypothetical protein AAB919_00295 [Patescibacteria group bacterium]
MNSLPAAIASLVLVAGAFGGGAVLAVLPRHSQSAAAAQALLRPIDLNPAALQAKAAVLYDAQTGDILFQKNAQTAMPLASLTKLMAAQAVLANRDPGTKIVITAADLKPEGDWGLRPGDALPLGKLLEFGLVASCNDCFAAAASSLGSDYLSAMNGIAVTLNLTKTYFLNPTGLDLSKTDAGAYGSAFDVARMTAGFYRQYPAIFGLTTHRAASIEVGGRTLTAEATAAPLQDIPGFMGGKTGYTDLAGGNLAAVFDLTIGRPVVAVVLHSTEAGRFADIRTLLAAARAALAP